MTNTSKIENAAKTPDAIDDAALENVAGGVAGPTAAQQAEMAKLEAQAAKRSVASLSEMSVSSLSATLVARPL